MESMIAICDLDTVGGRLVVVDQRDWHVPKFHLNAIEQLCRHTKAEQNCNGECEKCVITRITS